MTYSNGETTNMSNKKESTFSQGDAFHRLIEHLRTTTESTLVAQLSKEGIKYYLGTESVSREYIAFLRERGVLVELSYMSVVVCPNCGEYTLAISPTCPRCGSNDVTLVELYAHLKCGYIGLSSEFEKEGKIVCPNCGENISDISELKSYGKIFRCFNCGARFDTPLLKFRCLTCGLTFTVKEARIMRVPQYRLDKDALSKIESVVVQDYLNMLISEVVREFSDKFTIEQSVEVSGISGIKHVVPMRVRLPNATLYIYPVLKEQDAYFLISMLLDVNLSEPMVVICLEDVAKKARLSCSALGGGKSNVKVISLRNLDELRDKLREVLKGLLVKQS